jgi:hypothetical protein
MAGMPSAPDPAPSPVSPASPDSSSSPVTREDLDGICEALPEVTLGESWHRPAYLVGGKAFVRFREPRNDCLDPATGEPMEDLIVVTVADAGEKEALVSAEGPWFTIPHFDNYNAVLIRERDLGLLEYVELAEIVTEAWAARAPKKLVKQHLG